MDTVEKGKRIKIRMIKLGITGEDLRIILAGKGIDRTPSAISRALNGERADLLNKIHDVILIEEQKQLQNKEAV